MYHPTVTNLLPARFVRLTAHLLLSGTVLLHTSMLCADDSESKRSGATSAANQQQDKEQEKEQEKSEAEKPKADKPATAKPPENPLKKRTADVVYVATPHDVVAKMLDAIKVAKSDVVYDLGCGDGRFIVTAAKKLGCRGRGYDLDPQRVEESRENAKKAKVDDRIEIFQQDIFEVDLTPASVITLYLLPRLNERLIPQLQKMKPGSRIVCHDFPIPGMKIDRTFTITSREDGVEHKILVYSIPLQKE
ncbi:MAG: SAM-dependent methyltransferase [Planctomycetota bacterium]